MQGTTQAYKIWQYEWCNTLIKEREGWEPIDQTQTRRCVFRGSSTELYVPAFTEKDFQSTRSTELLSQLIQPPARQYKWSTEDRSTELHQYNQIHLYRRGIQAQSTSTEEGYKHQSNSTSPRGSKPQPQPLPKREQPTNQGGYNKWYISTTNQFSFPTNKWSYRIG